VSRPPQRSKVPIEIIARFGTALRYTNLRTPQRASNRRRLEPVTTRVLGDRHSALDVFERVIDIDRRRGGGMRTVES